MERTHARSGSPFEATIGFSRGVRIDDRCLISGTAPIWPDGSCPDDISIQADRCFEIVIDALADLGASPADVVRSRVYLVNPNHAEVVGQAHAAAFGPARPAATMVVVAGLLDPRWLVEVEAEAIVGSSSG